MDKKKFDLYETKYGFNEETKTIGYCPKPKKVVLCQQNTIQKISCLKENKKSVQSIDKKLPEIVNHYNMNKGGVDTVDHSISLYSCRRKTNRWTMNCFYYLIDLAASNAFILFAMNKNNKNETLLNDVSRQRRKSIEQLAFELVSKKIKSRAVQLGSNNFQGVHSDLQISLKRSLN